MKSPKLVNRLLAAGYTLLGAGRGRLVFGKPERAMVFKVSWRTKKDRNEIEWRHYQSLNADQKELVVPLLGFCKLIDGNSVLLQARAETVNKPSLDENKLAEQIMQNVGVLDHIPRNFGYYGGKLRILDVDSVVKR